MLRWKDCPRASGTGLSELFAERVFPVLTPLAVDPAHPFPYISGLSLNLAVVFATRDGRDQFARVKVPPMLPRFLPWRRTGSCRSRTSSPPTWTTSSATCRCSSTTRSG